MAVTSIVVNLIPSLFSMSIGRGESMNIVEIAVSQEKKRGRNAVSHDWRDVSMAWFVGRPLIDSCTAYACEIESF